MTEYDCKEMHNFEEVKECEHKHCRKCGTCQCINGCYKIIKEEDDVRVK